jgi:hypothetical protein
MVQAILQKVGFDVPLAVPRPPADPLACSCACWQGVAEGRRGGMVQAISSLHSNEGRSSRLFSELNLPPWRATESYVQNVPLYVRGRPRRGFSTAKAVASGGAWGGSGRGGGGGREGARRSLWACNARRANMGFSPSKR